MNPNLKFLLKNISKGLLWLFIIIALYLVFSYFVEESHYERYLERIYDRPLWFYAVFAVSEIVFGIIPPELFMLVSAHSEDIIFYTFSISILSVISYGAGALGYFIGSSFKNSNFYRRLHQKYLYQYIQYLRKFGGLLIIVASVTPVPFSAIAMLVGAAEYPKKKYFAFALFRFLRFLIYSILIYRTNLIA